MTDIFDVIVEMPEWISATANGIVEIFMDSWYNNTMKVMNVVLGVIEGLDGDLPFFDAFTTGYRWMIDVFWNAMEDFIPGSSGISLFDLILTVGLPMVIGLTIIKWIIGIFT